MIVLSEFANPAFCKNINDGLFDNNIPVAIPIAASSLATDWIRHKTIDQAFKLNNVEIVEELSLPPVKIHCSVLAEDAIKAAIKDYQNKQIVGASN